jgi:hypothetical protein
MVDIKRQTKKLAGRSFIPSVIEPSFGIGRILYCVFEHSYYTREGDESRAVLKFTPLVAPVKATVRGPHELGMRSGPCGRRTTRLGRSCRALRADLSSHAALPRPPPPRCSPWCRRSSSTRWRPRSAPGKQGVEG